ncbi:MAG TPA: aminotransferase class I/II-fold pyridoxal phosphate-dependent enzyme [Polyangiaceae bacterium]|nr:aminotransferase class I/II-fold pyridoxal phosphate-dependent enzyme [Polyangiaceae bacterium]
MAKLTRERKNQTVFRVLGEAQQHGLILNRAGSANGPECVIGGRVYRNFGSCSYMALEAHPALRAGAAAALEAYGTQFHFSRAYVESPLYQELENALEAITGRPTLVAASTTLAHLSALPVLVQDDDVVLIDQFAHASLHMATELLKGTIVERVRHNRMDVLEDKIKAHRRSGRTIWYVCDGVYSMLGDFADFAALKELLARYPELHLYIDDAHAVSWAGNHGRGVALTHLGDSERVVVALSLNKAFSGAGGALAVPHVGVRTRIRRCGGTMVFSGPIQPPMLGASLASAKLHLDPGFAALQAELEQRLRVAREAIARHHLPVATTDSTPIVMVQFDSAERARSTVKEMMERGYYCCFSSFPAVPIDRPSLRFTLSRHNDLADVPRFVENLAEVVARRRETSAVAVAAL